MNEMMKAIREALSVENGFDDVEILEEEPNVILLTWIRDSDKSFELRVKEF